ncbi:hypothetical protein [Acidithiobacillus sp.]|nr:hypothetical protein [Acidithiobacillus sp.]MDD5374436.1 hypothetical protein [Acidithiobacillus sp.]
MTLTNWIQLGAIVTNTIVIGCFVNDWLDKRAARAPRKDSEGT